MEQGFYLHNGTLTLGLEAVGAAGVVGGLAWGGLASTGEQVLQVSLEAFYPEKDELEEKMEGEGAGEDCLLWQERLRIFIVQSFQPHLCLSKHSHPPSHGSTPLHRALRMA